MSERQWIVRDNKASIAYAGDEISARNYLYAHKDQGYWLEPPSLNPGVAEPNVSKRIDIFDAITASARGS